MMRPFFIKTKTFKNFRPIKALITIGDYMDYFLKKRLERIRLEFQELMGMLSIKELTTNFRLTNNYQSLHLQMIKI